ncbi:hypothetical protein QE357_004725 [Siphonobacter sp. BAB-5404]|nr:hypothetical protein [Siphonobacter sp. SORGH_AS_0500]
MIQLEKINKVSGNAYNSLFILPRRVILMMRPYHVLVVSQVKGISYYRDFIMSC